MNRELSRSVMFHAIPSIVIFRLMSVVICAQIWISGIWLVDLTQGLPYLPSLSVPTLPSVFLLFKTKTHIRSGCTRFIQLSVRDSYLSMVPLPYNGAVLIPFLCREEIISIAIGQARACPLR